MASSIEIFVIAFLAQLAVLPGEKGQFIIAGLATRYHPLGVVGAASVAFAGWTVLEIWFGQTVQARLPAIGLDLVTAGLFVLFAVLLLRSAPPQSEPADSPNHTGDPTDEDLGIPAINAHFPPTAGTYGSIFLLLAAGEFGDKTQLITIGLAIKYGAHPAIWAGEMLAIIPVSLVNAYCFNRFSDRLSRRRVHVVAAGLFAFFAIDAMLALTTGISVWEMALNRVTALNF